MPELDPEARSRVDDDAPSAEAVEPDQPDQPGPAMSDAPQPKPPANLWSGAMGAVIAVAVCGLVMLGLWAVAREAPSAGTDPRLQPNPTVAPVPGQFEQQIYITIEADAMSPPADNPDGG